MTHSFPTRRSSGLVPAMYAELEAPAVDLGLVPSEAGGPPGGVGLQRGGVREEERQQRAAHRQGVADPKHELDVQGPTDRALLGKSGGSVQHARVEDLDLRLDVLCQQQLGQLVDELRRVLIDPVGEVYRARGKGSHLGHQAERALALFMVTAAARSEEHTSELQSLMRISYAVFCLKKKNTEVKDKDID